MKVPDKMGVHIEERRVGSVYGGDILARLHWFEYDAFLVKIPRNIKSLPKLRHTLSTLIQRRNLHGHDFKSYSN
jgi:hypothetical protein